MEDPSDHAAARNIREHDARRKRSTSARTEKVEGHSIVGSNYPSRWNARLSRECPGTTASRSLALRLSVIVDPICRLVVRKRGGGRYSIKVNLQGFLSGAF